VLLSKFETVQVEEGKRDEKKKKRRAFHILRA